MPACHAAALNFPAAPVNLHPTRHPAISACAASLALQTDASALTEESCTQYNMLKTARYLFRHTGDPGGWRVGVRGVDV